MGQQDDSELTEHCVRSDFGARAVSQGKKDVVRPPNGKRRITRIYSSPWRRRHHRFLG